MYDIEEHHRAFRKFCGENNPLRKIRRNIGGQITQKDLADILGCHSATVGMWERGFDLPPTYTQFGDKIRELAKQFGVDPNKIGTWSKVSRENYKRLKKECGWVGDG